VCRRMLNIKKINTHYLHGRRGLVSSILARRAGFAPSPWRPRGDASAAAMNSSRGTFRGGEAEG